jgi:hypothetical protein
MNREIITDPLDATDLKTDLHQNMALLQDMNIKKVLLLFGFAWGKFIYPGNWEDMAATPVTVEAMVRNVEKKGYGSLGNDNLYITVPTLKIRLQYSYEGDIHLSYSSPDNFVQQVFQRWSKSDWFIESKKKRL